ncbi:OsmC family protein [Conchiformibius kuhniae]|uniref:OsmC family protein n=1 Tax=Conchiformibius kuhniae TaxID=211502 RepID=A0A8T9MXL9_9NEIS|nr:OsmC family protein [Conchiformibius kuhniae]UOP04633.1 OsmC family protein [Conchiformibius kuhniae]
MKITSEWVSGRCFAATNESGHSILSDGAAAGEGKRAPSPMELLLMGIAGCSGIDVVEILQKQRQDIRACTAAVSAERADSVPKVFTKIHIHFKVAGAGIKAEAVERAVKLSAEKYCSASIMLGKAAEISHSFEVEDTAA